MNKFRHQRRTWSAKFTDAFRGIWYAVFESSSFAVHFTLAVAVMGLAAWLRMDQVRWCLLILCIATVMAAETFNYAIERMARAVNSEYHPELGKALDAASGAVLIAAIGSAVVGLIVFIPPVLSVLSIF